jgi:proteasome lid subunit RPN8/RPN11
MVDSPLPDDIITLIKEHAHREIPKESCGVVLIRKGRRSYVECTNIAELDCFKIDPVQFAKLQLSGDIEYVVHSHTSGNKPSEHDISACSALKLPYLIYYCETDTYSINYHEGYNKLLGRDYLYGKQDCFEAARDWFLVHGIIVPARKKWIDNDQDMNYNYMENEVLDWPLEQVKTPIYGDVLLLSVLSKKPNHIAIYLENDMIFHHAVNRLSCRENMYPFWAENIYGIYRYANIPIQKIRF